MVSPLAKGESEISAELPMTIVAAMVSPSARPSAMNAPPTMPGQANGMTTPRIACQRVAPSACAPWRWAIGTARITSNEIAAMYGKIMIAIITPQANTPLPLFAPEPPISTKPSLSHGANTTTPQKP